MYNKISKILCAIIVSLILCSCGTSRETDSGDELSIYNTVSETDKDNLPDDSAKEAGRELFAMDTYMTLKAYGSNAEEAVDKAVEEIKRLDALLSTGLEDSEISQLNKSGTGVVTKDTAYLLERSLELYNDTDGAFNIAIYPVMKAWGFTNGEYTVPSDEALASLRTLTDASKIDFDSDNSKVSFGTESMEIDLGGIAKGYTSARIMDIYRECGVTSGLVNLGGNAQVLGTKPDKSNWKVAVQSPWDDGYLGVLGTKDRAVITSGGYERYFEKDGVTYHHIINPETFYPADSGLVSVTIVSADGTLADGLATSLYIMGRDKAIEYWRDRSDMFDIVLAADDGTLYVSEGIADDFISDYQFSIVEKKE